MRKEAKYLKYDMVKIADSPYSTCWVIIEKIDYEPSNDTYYYTVSDDDRPWFQVSENQILDKYEQH